MKIDFRDIFKVGLTIRCAEQVLLDKYKSRDFGGTVHTCIGQELGTAIMAAITRDYEPMVFSNHRGHGHFIAHTGNIDGLFSEFLGVEGAACGGIGGSQHLYGENFLSNGIQGQTSPVSVGYALSRPTILYLGDGTFGEGTLYEALNLASTNQAKIAFVVEDNSISQSTPSTSVIAGSIHDKFTAFGIEAITLDFFKDDESFAKSLINIQETVFTKPLGIILKLPRLYSHSKGDDTRNADKIQKLWANDPLSKLATKLDFNLDDEIGLVSEALNAKWEELKANPPIEPHHNFLDTFRRLPKLVSSTYFEHIQNNRINEVIRDQISNFLEADALFIGEDVKHKWDPVDEPYNGAFAVSGDLSEKFPQQVISTSISEAGITGLALGFVLATKKPAIVEIMFADFLSLITDQLFNGVEKYKNMFGRQIDIPLLIRCPYGAGRGYGPTHSQAPWSLLRFANNIQIISMHPLLDISSLSGKILAEGLPIVQMEPKLDYGINQKKFYDQCSSKISEVLDYDVELLITGRSTKAPRVNVVCHGSTVTAAMSAFDNSLGYDIFVVSNLNFWEVNELPFRDCSLPILVIEESNGAVGPMRVNLEQFYEKSQLYSLGSTPDIIPSNTKIEERYKVTEHKISEFISELME